MADNVEQSYREQRDKLRQEFEQAGSPGGDFYNWMCNRLDAAIIKEREAKEKWKARKWKKKVAP